MGCGRKEASMKIAVFGLGYVGCVSSACLADNGHEVVGVDINEFKVDAIVKGQSPIIEKDLDVLISAGVKAGNLTATTDVSSAVRRSELSFICVGTPSEDDGDINMGFVHRVAENLGAALKDASGFHAVVFRSTMLPGSMEGQVIPRFLESCRRGLGEGIGIGYNPEFLREGSAVRDFLNPPLTLLAATDGETEECVRRAYGFTEAPIVTTNMKCAEMVKYVNNAFHGMKVSFANEIGALCKREGIDGRDVMRIFCMDDKLNLSASYLEPGFAFGGSCLPKDLKALARRFETAEISAPLIRSVLTSNSDHIGRIIQLIENAGGKKIGILGLSFKAGTDDLRGSPVIKIVEALVGKGYDVSIYDANVDLARIIGTNREFLEKEVPYLPSILKPSIGEILNSCEVIVVTNKSREFTEVPGIIKPGQALIDVVGIPVGSTHVKGKYLGICW